MIEIKIPRLRWEEVKVNESISIWRGRIKSPDGPIVMVEIHPSDGAYAVYALLPSFLKDGYKGMFSRRCRPTLKADKRRVGRQEHPKHLQDAKGPQRHHRRHIVAHARLHEQEALGAGWRSQVEKEGQGMKFVVPRLKWDEAPKNGKTYGRIPDNPDIWPLFIIRPDPYRRRGRLEIVAAYPAWLHFHTRGGFVEPFRGSIEDAKKEAQMMWGRTWGRLIRNLRELGALQNEKEDKE